MTNLRLGCLTAAAIVITLILAFGLAVILGLMRLPLTNLDRIVTQHTLQYVQTHQTVVLHYYADWQVAPDEAHKRSDVLQACAEAALLDRSEWPDQAAGFLSANCR